MLGFFWNIMKYMFYEWKNDENKSDGGCYKFLIMGIKLAVEKIWKWVTVKYISLFIFCYSCGILGYMEREFF